MRYSDQKSLTSAASTPGTWTYRANGMYDPQYLAGGHQPLTFDQYMTFYNHFTVVGAKATLRVVHAEATPLMIGIYVTGGASHITNVSQLMEQPKVKYVMVPQQSEGGGFITLTYKLSIAKFLGIKKLLSDDTVRGTATSDPTEECYFQFFAYRPDGTAITQCQFFLSIDYKAVLTEPTVIPQST